MHGRSRRSYANRFAQEGRLLGVALDQMDMASGVSANAQASTTPGKPPPLPRSTQTFADGARSES